MNESDMYNFSVWGEVFPQINASPDDVTAMGITQTDGYDFNLTINFVILITGGDWYDVQVSTILNGLILIYMMLPGTRRAFGADKPQQTM